MILPFHQTVNRANSLNAPSSRHMRHIRHSHKHLCAFGTNCACVRIVLPQWIRKKVQECSILCRWTISVHIVAHISFLAHRDRLNRNNRARARIHNDQGMRGSLPSLHLASSSHLIHPVARSERFRVVMANVTAVVNPVTTTQMIHRAACLSSRMHLHATCTFSEVPIERLRDLPNAEEQR